jgi:hypothetical protein
MVKSVAIGMALAFSSRSGGPVPAGRAEAFIRHLSGAPPLPSPASRRRPGGERSATAHDDKSERRQLTFILLRGLGRAFVTRCTAGGGKGSLTA